MSLYKTCRECHTPDLTARYREESARILCATCNLGASIVATSSGVPIITTDQGRVFRARLLGAQERHQDANLGRTWTF